MHVCITISIRIYKLLGLNILHIYTINNGRDVQAYRLKFSNFLCTLQKNIRISTGSSTISGFQRVSPVLGGDFSWPPSKTPCLLAWWVVTKDDATATCSQRPSRKRPRRVSRPDGRSKMKNRAMWNNLKEWHCGVLAFSEWQLTKFTRAESFTCFWFLSYLHASQPGTIPMLWWISINLEPFITTLSLSLSLVPSFLTFHSKSMIFLK